MVDLNNIAPAFSFIVNKGFAPSTATYDAESFGNASLLMSGIPFSLRIKRDRGQVFVDIGSDAAGWHRLEFALEFLDTLIQREEIGVPPNVCILAALLQARWDMMVRLLSDHQKMTQLKAFEKQKTDSLISEIFGNA